MLVDTLSLYHFISLSLVRALSLLQEKRSFKRNAPSRETLLEKKFRQDKLLQEKLLQKKLLQKKLLQEKRTQR